MYDETTGSRPEKPPKTERSPQSPEAAIDQAASQVRQDVRQARVVVGKLEDAGLGGQPEAQAVAREAKALANRFDALQAQISGEQAPDRKAELQKELQALQRENARLMGEYQRLDQERQARQAEAARRQSDLQICLRIGQAFQQLNLGQYGPNWENVVRQWAQYNPHQFGQFANETEYWIRSGRPNPQQAQAAFDDAARQLDSATKTAQNAWNSGAENAQRQQAIQGQILEIDRSEQAEKRKQASQAEARKAVREEQEQEEQKSVAAGEQAFVQQHEAERTAREADLSAAFEAEDREESEKTLGKLRKLDREKIEQDSETARESGRIKELKAQLAELAEKEKRETAKAGRARRDDDQKAEDEYRKTKMGLQTDASEYNLNDPESLMVRNRKRNRETLAELREKLEETKARFSERWSHQLSFKAGDKEYEFSRQQLAEGDLPQEAINGDLDKLTDELRAAVEGEPTKIGPFGKTKHEEWRKKTAELRARIDELKRLSETLKETQDSTRHDLSGARREIEDTEKDVQKWEEAVKRDADEEDGMRQKIREAQRLLASGQLEAGLARNKDENLAKSERELHQTLKGIGEDATRIRREIDGAESRQRQAEYRSSELKREALKALDELRTRIDRLDDKELKKEMESLERSIGRL